jgi:hypothetical protein
VAKMHLATVENLGASEELVMLAVAALARNPGRFRHQLVNFRGTRAMLNALAEKGKNIGSRCAPLRAEATRGHDPSKGIACP